MQRTIRMGVRAIGATVLGVTLLLLAACDSPEEKKAAHYKRGQELLADGDMTKAVLEFKNVLQIDEDHVGALYGLAKFQQQKQNWTALVGVLRKILDLDPAHVDARIDFCRMMLLGGAYDRAIKVCGEAEKLDGRNTKIFALQAAIHHKLQNYPRAVTLANKALEIDGTNIDALIVLAARHLAEGEPKEALARLDQGLKIDDRNIGLSVFKIRILEQLKDVAGTEAVFRKLIKFYPKNRSFRLAFVRYYLSKEKKDAAEVEIRAYATANPDSVAPALDVVNFLKVVRGDSAAEAELRKLAERKPAVHQYKLSLASLLWTLGKKDDARKVTQNIIDTGAKEAIPLAKLQLARMLLTEKKTKDAENLIAALLATDSRNVDALLMRASIRGQRGAYDDAISDLRTALNETPRAMRVLLPLARLHEMNGSVELAEERLAIATRSSGFNPTAGLSFARFLLRHSKAKEAEEILNRVVERAPNNVAVLTLLAQLRLNRQDWAGAQRIADQIAKLKDNKGLSQQIQGAVLSGQKKFDESISILRQAQSATPTAVQPIVSLVNTYIRAGKLDDARSFLDDIVASDPKRVDAHILIGSLLIRQGKREEARARYALAIKNNPEDPRGYRALAVYLMGVKNTEAAIKVLADGIGRMPKDIGLNLLSAGIKERNGDIEGAIEIYERMNEVRPGSMIVANNLASLLAEHRTDVASLDKAYALARRLRGTNIPQFKDTLAWVQFKRGQRDAAISLLREATESTNPLPMYFYHLGAVYAADDLDELAREHFTKALKLGEKQSFDFADQTRAALKKLDEKAKVRTN